MRTAKVKPLITEYRYDTREERYIPDVDKVRMRKAAVLKGRDTTADKSAKEQVNELFSSRLQGEHGLEQQELQELFNRVKQSNVYYQRHIVVRQLKSSN
ncbi:hypothetical protein ACW5WN_01325 [Aeromonas lacus]